VGVVLVVNVVVCEVVCEVVAEVVAVVVVVGEVVGVVVVGVVVGDVVGVVRWQTFSGLEKVPETSPSSILLSIAAVSSHASPETASQLMLSQVTASSDSSTDCHLLKPAVIISP
jgi:hypothetical protein